jgi:hypothetical protein
MSKTKNTKKVISSDDESSTSKTLSSHDRLLSVISDILTETTMSEKQVKNVIDSLSSTDAAKKLKPFLGRAPSGTKNAKKAKDPNLPKGKKSAYIIFSSENRAKVKEENPDLKSSEILSKLGAEWKALSDKKKEKYNKLAEADKERYLEEMKDYEPSDGFDKKETKPSKTIKSDKKDETLVKPTPAYMVFIKEYRPKVKDAMPDDTSTKNVSIELNKVWKGTSDVLTLSKKDRAKFDKANEQDDTSEDEDIDVDDE